MHILVPTDGTLSADEVSAAVARWHREGDKVTVLTVLNIPTDFLRRLGESGVKEAAKIAHEAGQGFTSGDRAAEQLSRPHQVSSRPPTDSPVLSTLASSAESRTGPIVAALKTAGIDADATWATTDNKVARTVLRAVKKYGSELVIIGSHGRGRFEGKLGSTGTKLVRLCPAPVLVIRDLTVTAED